MVEPGAGRNLPGLLEWSLKSQNSSIEKSRRRDTQRDAKGDEFPPALLEGPILSF